MNEGRYRVFFNYAAHDFNNVQRPMFVHYSICKAFALYHSPPNAPVNYYNNPMLGNLHWPTVKGVKDWDEKNQKNGYVP